MFSDEGVRYYDGLVKVDFGADLTSGGFGDGWSHTPIWTNKFLEIPLGRSYSGNDWTVSEQPYLFRLIEGSDASIGVVSTATNVRYFDLQSTYVGRHFILDKLEKTTGEFKLTDTTGNQFVFFDFSPGDQPGQLKKFTDPFGNVTSLTYTNGKPTLVQRSYALNGSPRSNSLCTPMTAVVPKSRVSSLNGG